MAVYKLKPLPKNYHLNANSSLIAQQITRPCFQLRPLLYLIILDIFVLDEYGRMQPSHYMGGA